MNFEHPLRTSNAELGMNVQLRKERMHIRTDKNDDFIPMNSENGFHLTFNDPFEILSEDSPNFFAVFNRTTSFTINPKKFNFDDSISIYSSEQWVCLEAFEIFIEKNSNHCVTFSRHCYLPGERNLKHFKVYNKLNCDHECLANLTLQTCGCVQFFSVRSESTRICGIADAKCFNKIEEKFSIIKSDCKCFKACERIDYEVEMKIVDFNKWEDLKKNWNKFQSKLFRELFDSATFNVRFKDDEFYQLLFKRQYTNSDILAFTGGLLGNLKFPLNLKCRKNRFQVYLLDYLHCRWLKYFISLVSGFC